MMQKEVSVGFNLLFIITLTFILGCDNTEFIDTTYFFMNLSENTDYHLKEDSTALEGKIIIDEDTVIYKFGLVGSFYEPEPSVIYIPSNFDKSKMLVDTNQVFLTDNRFYDVDRYRKQQVYFRKIDNHFCKITQPNGAFENEGMTGVYIDSVAVNDNCVWGFILYGENLSLKNQQVILQSLPTLRLKNLNVIKVSCVVN